MFAALTFNHLNCIYCLSFGRQDNGCFVFFSYCNKSLFSLACHLNPIKQGHNYLPLGTGRTLKLRLSAASYETDKTSNNWSFLPDPGDEVLDCVEKEDSSVLMSALDDKFSSRLYPT